MNYYYLLFGLNYYLIIMYIVYLLIVWLKRCLFLSQKNQINYLT